MKNTKSIFWGGLLMLVGAGWLLRNLGYLDVYWSDIFRYWPVFLILAGVTILVSGRERSGYGGGLAGIFIGLAVLGGVSNKSHNIFRNRGDGFGFRWDRDREDRVYEREDYEVEKRSRKTTTALYSYPIESGIEEATLNFEGGAGTFRIGGETDKLLEGNSKSDLINYVTKVIQNSADGKATIDFEMEDTEIKLNKRSRLKNEMDLKLSSKPAWNVNIQLGAGKADVDLSSYRVKSVRLETGASDINLKLGKAPGNTDVNIESGVASVQVEIPTTTGCRLRIDGALNSKTLDGFVNKGDGVYETPGYNETSDKIQINYDAGISSFRVRRY